MRLTDTAHQLGLLARRFAAARRARRGGDDAEGGPSPADLAAGFRDLLARAPADAVRTHALVDLPASELPWRETGITLRRGDEVSVFAAGRVWLAPALDLWAGPQFQLWFRVGREGPIFNGPRAHHSFVAPRDGALEIGGQLPGQWGDPSGRVATPLTEYEKVSGGFAVCVLVWPGTAADGLARLAETGDVAGLLAAERARLAAPARPPAGWRYLWFLGESEIFTAAAADERPAIACDTHADVGILQRDVSVPLASGTRLRWRWRVDELPSRIAEDARFTHDYLSIAVELSNGRDLTYTWSWELAPETGYWCPLPTWRDRELHVVVRSGPAGLGTWQSEERDVAADYRRFVGEPPPAITRVWLIANSMFQRGRGRCLFADISIAHPGGVLQVL